MAYMTIDLPKKLHNFPLPTTSIQVWIACMLAARAPAHDEALGNGSGDAREALTSLQPVEGQAVRQEGGQGFPHPENGALEDKAIRG